MSTEESRGRRGECTVGAVRDGGAEFLVRWLVGMFCQTGKRPPTLSPNPSDRKTALDTLSESWARVNPSKHAGGPTAEHRDAGCISQSMQESRQRSTAVGIYIYLHPRLPLECPRCCGGEHHGLERSLRQV